MANIYNGLLYNDDIDMGIDDTSSLPASIQINPDDESTYVPPEPPEETTPEVIDLDPSDTITRVLDGWEKDLSTEGGEAGETYNNTPPTEKPEDPPQRTKTVYTQTQTMIADYSQSYLQKFVDAGAKFYVIYTDGTRDEVSVSEIHDPHPGIESTIQIETEAIAKAINQYFWHDTNGVHVTDTERNDWEDALADEFPDWPTVPYHNILMNSLGILLRTQLLNLASLSRSGVAFFDGEGNTANNILASFGINGSVLRANGRDVLRVTPNGVVFVPLEGNEISVTMITDNIDNLTNLVASNKSEVDTALSNLQNQIDGVVDTYYEEVDPEYDDILSDSSGNDVIDSSSEVVNIHIKTPWMYGWYTVEEQAAHEGDLYYNILTGHAWRWLKVDNVWQWYRIADSDVAQALQIARDANTLAGSKRRVFTSTPTVPYDIGDIWVTGSEVRYATIAKAVGSSYAESDWEQTATDDTLAQTALNKANDNAGEIVTLKGDVTLIKRDYVTNATYEQNNRTWSANLSSLETSVKQYTDNSILTEVTNRNAAITAESTSIKQVVSANYQAKGDYATNAALQNEITNRDSAIETRAGSILQTVSETYATQEELGTYVDQTSDSITTIIGDLSSVESVIHYQEERIRETDTILSDKNNAYYGNTDPFIEGNIEDSSGNDVTDSSNGIVIYKALTASSQSYRWVTVETRNKHVGDLYFNTVTGRTWRYTNSYQWEYIENKDATNALAKATALEELNLPASVEQARTEARNASQAATQANTTANSKTRTFTTTPTPPYNVGDVWVDGSTIKYCVIAQGSGGTYNVSHWRVTATDDSALNTYKSTVATIIREISSGVLVAKAGASIGTLQGSSNFQIVGINQWSGSTPTIGATYALFGANGLSVYDNTGTTELTFIGIKNNLAFSRLGRSDKGNVQIGVNSSGNGYIDFYNSTTQLAHIGYDAGNNSSSGISNAPAYSLGQRKENSDVGNYSLVEGLNNTASGWCSHAEGYDNVASYILSHVEGRSNISSGWSSHAEGTYNTASGNASHAEGAYNTASGYGSHAEGDSNTASGYFSHAEGYINTASGYGSHAEGSSTTASGMYSHAGGVYNIAAYDYQTVIGKYNKNLSSDLFEIGNGTAKDDAHRSNAFRVTTSNTAYVGSTYYSSDKRIKTDLGILDDIESLMFIKSLIPHKYEKFGRKELGFFAQDVEQDPNYGDILVDKYEDHGYEDFRSLSYDGLIAPLVSTVQNMLKRIEAIEERLYENERGQ